MIYKIKEIEGVDHFLKTHYAYDADRGGKPSVDMLFSNREFDSTKQSWIPIKSGFLKVGDQVVIVLTEFTSYTRQQISTETLFDVVKHDDFLLKLVKQKP